LLKYSPQFGVRLWAEGTVAIHLAACVEAVKRHVSGKHKENEYEEKCK
jgi:hypothetical protein